MILFIFCTCSIMGYIMEISYKLTHGQDYHTAGMSKGPFCITYGCAGIILYLNNNNNIFYMFIFSMMVLTLVEYISGMILEKIFNITLWDYTNQFFCISKYVCLKFMILWGILGVIYAKILLPILIYGFNKLDTNIVLLFCIVIIIIMVIDYGLVAINQIKKIKLKRQIL